MSTSVTLPALGESVTEGTVSRWLKQVGDTVEADEPLLEVSTDKVDTEIPSPTSGVLLEIKAQEDETVEVGAVLAVIGEASEAGGDSGGERLRWRGRRRRVCRRRCAEEAPAYEPSQDTSEPEPEPAAQPDEPKAEDSGPAPQFGWRIRERHRRHPSGPGRERHRRHGEPLAQAGR